MMWRTGGKMHSTHLWHLSLEHILSLASISGSRAGSVNFRLIQMHLQALLSAPAQDLAFWPAGISPSPCPGSRKPSRLVHRISQPPSSWSSPSCVLVCYIWKVSYDHTFCCYVGGREFWLVEGERHEATGESKCSSIPSPAVYPGIKMGLCRWVSAHCHHHPRGRR